MDKDLDLAIALSLSEAESKHQGCGHSNRFDQMKKDEALAKQLSLGSDNKRQQDEDASLALALDYEQKEREAQEKEKVQRSANSNSNSNGRSSSGAPNACFVCGNTSGYVPSITAVGRKYCVSCFCCAACQTVLNGRFFQNLEKQQDKDAVYCATCVKIQFSPKCSVCDLFLEGRFYRHHYFEDEKYCLSHEDISKRRKCSSCQRLEPTSGSSSTKGPFVDLPDQRCVCLECLSSAVMTTDEMQALYCSVVDFMQNHTTMPFPAGLKQAMLEVPVLAVDVVSINEQRAQGATTHGGGLQVQQNVRGLTLSRIGEVTHYAQGDMAFSYQGGFSVAPPRILRVDTHREVTAVLVLYGLPRDLTASILAHEAMHVWIKLNKAFPFQLQPRVEEGLCQQVAMQYLRHLDKEESRRKKTQEGGRIGTGRGLGLPVHTAPPTHHVHAHPSQGASSSAGQTKSGGGLGGGVRTGGFDFLAWPPSIIGRKPPKPVKPVKPVQVRTGPNFGSNSGIGGQTKSEGGIGVSACVDDNVALENKLRGFFQHSIAEDPSEIYGDGYRDAAKVVDTLGLDITLDCVKDTEQLPRV